MFKSRREVVFFVIVVIAAVFAIFPRLASQPLREWDESRLAVSAYEMYESGNYLVSTFEYKADLWNTKPPLLLWLQALGMKVFGVGLLAVRLPSAMALFLSSVALFCFFAKVKRPLAGFYSAMILICSKGLLTYHFGRSGDYDSLMTLFCVLYCGFFYLYHLFGRKRDWIFFSLCLSLGVLTKGVQAMMPLAGIVLFLLCRRELLRCLRQPITYIGMGIFLLLVGGFYISRELASGGYLQAVWNNEIGGRFFTVIEEHNQKASYYLDMLRVEQFSYFFWLFPIALITNFFTKEKNLRQANLYCGLVAVVYLVIISVAKTKLEWYSLPAIPALAAVIGLCFERLHMIAERKISEKAKNRVLFSSLCFMGAAVVFCFPYSQIVRQNIECEVTNKYLKEDNARVDLMRRVAERRTNMPYKEICCLKNEKRQLYVFYYYLMERSGVRLNEKDLSDLQEGDYVQVNDWGNEEKILQNYFVEETDATPPSHIYYIKSLKHKENENIGNHTEL